MSKGRTMNRVLRWLAGWLLAVLALTHLGVRPAIAQGTPDHVLFGPVQYDRTDGPPNEYSATFSVPGSVGAPFLLRIVNGAANGQNRISSGRVTVNGVQYVGPADFGQNVALIERSVTLSPSNTVQVRLTSAPGSYIAMSVLGTRILPAPTSLAPNPISITAGATGTLTATLSPTPTAAGVLALSSAHPSIASVPASVAFGVGQASVPIPVTAVAPGTTSVTASANGGSSSATVNVNPAPPTIAALAPSTLSIMQGSSGTLTVTISSAQAGATTVSVASSDSGVASVPASVNVPAGQVSASIPVSAVAPGRAQVTASLNGSSAFSEITVTPLPPTVTSLLPAVSTVSLGSGTSLTLTISAAQSSDTAVPLSVTPPGIVSTPAEVVVPAGQLTAQVAVATLALGQAGITVSLNGSSASAAVNVVAPPVAVTALEPATFTMNVGATSIFTVRINAAQTTNTLVALESSNPAALQVPASVTIAQGTTSATFTATGLAVGDATITAFANGTSKSATVHVSPEAAAIVSLLPAFLPLQQGATGTLTVTINVAQEGDTTVALTNTDAGIVAVPPFVVVPAGTVSAQILLRAVAPGLVQVTASVNATSAAASVEVTPPPPVVTAITPATVSLPKGTPGILRVTLSRAPNADTAVMLASNNPGVASVPPEVNVPAGALFAEFPVTANAVGEATISATLNGVTQTSTVHVAAAELVMLTLSPQVPTNYIGEAVPFTATGTMTDGTTEDFTPRVNWTSSNADVATIGATGIATLHAVGQTTIGASFTFTAVQTAQPVTISTSTVLTSKMPTPLTLSAPVTTLQVTQSVTVTVSTTEPPPFGGLEVSLSATGAGTATFPATVTIPEYQTSVTFELTATGPGLLMLTASAPTRLPANLTFTIQPQFAITSFTPITGPVGTAVAISGAGFDPNLAGNTVRFNGEQAVIVSGGATLLNAIVPPRATTGPITVTNFRGTATSATPFTVQDREAFDFTLTPAAIQAPRGGIGNTLIRLSSTGLNPYPYAAALSISGLPAGVTSVLDRPMVALNQDAILTLSAQSAAAPGTYTVTVTATGPSGVTTQTRSKTFTVEILAAGATTVTGRVFHADDDKPFVGARVRLGTAAVFTDATGTYRFVNPPLLGDQVVLIDGNTANTAEVEFPSGIAMPVMIVAGQDSKVLTSFIQRVDATKFTTVVPGQAASVTNPDIPNFSLNIPQGATLTGWDGQPITKINVRTVSVDRLPIRPIPEGVETRTVYLYYFFREGGATPSQPIPVTMANDIDALPGEQITLWYYDESATPDPNSNQWRVMGLGTVSADGKTIVSNPGVGMPKFCCGASFPGRGSGGDDTGGMGGDGDDDGGWGDGSDDWGWGDDDSTDPNPDDVADADDPPTTTPCPVDLRSGNALVFRARPFGMTKLMSLNPNCRYRSTDPRIGIFGRGMSFTYDWFAEAVGNEAVRVTNPQGVRYLLSRESDGVFRSRTGRRRAIEMEVTPTATGRKLRLASAWEFEFNTRGQLIAMASPRGNRTTFTLNTQGFPQAMTDPAGKVYTFQLIGTAASTKISRMTDPAGRFVQFEYDASQRLIRYTDQGGGITQLDYDANNRISRMTDPRGAVKQIEYDAAGRAVRELLPEGGEERYSYTAFGRTVLETRYTNANGNTTTYRFNGLGYTTQTIDATGRVTRYERDSINNRLRRKIDPAGRITQYTYNARGEPIRVIDADGKQTLIEYDLRFKKPVRIENALGHVTTMEYNNQARLSKITNAENETTTYTYTALGQVETITDPLGRVTRFAYDSNGNLIETTNAAGETVTRAYDLANRLIETTDNLNRTNRFAYDDLDRLVQVTDAFGGLTKYTYDANDNRLTVTDPNNHAIETNVYDLRNRLKQHIDPKLKSTSYDYDAAGNLISSTDRKFQTTMHAYDALNRVIEVRDHDGRVTTYAYDLAGNLSRISDTQSGDILMSYDVMNRVTEIVTPQGTVSYAYDAIGRRISRTISGGDITIYTYDRINRLKGVTLRGKTAAYSYDAAGRLSEKVLPNGIKATYQYDAADRVTSIAYTKPDLTAIETIGYTYDLGGQRTSRALGSTSLQETPFTANYDESNRLTSITLSGEIFTLSYDDNGNLTSKAGATSGTTSYAWDARNQLIAVSSPLVAATFRYDALGRRVEKTVNGATTGFLYDGKQAIAELKGGSLHALYHTALAIDEVLARYGALGDKTLLTDALMSVIAQANDDHSVANFYAYSPYGEASALGPEEDNSLQYTGRENDGTGLYYYRARYYDPLLKRFISEDPIGVIAGPNYYAYVNGKPIRYTDPDGKILQILEPVHIMVAMGSAAMVLGTASFIVGYGAGTLVRLGAEAIIGDSIGGAIHDALNPMPNITQPTPRIPPMPPAVPPSPSSPGSPPPCP